MYNLFLDDIRNPVEVGNYIYPIELRQLYRKLKWKIIRNYNDFVKIIEKNGLPEIVSFDHDLALIHYNPLTHIESFEYDEKTGFDCAKWLVNYCINNSKILPVFYSHSMNPIGKENIIKYLNNFSKHNK